MNKARLIHFFHHSNRISLAASLIIAEKFIDQQLFKNQLLLKSGQVADTYFFLDSGYMRSFAQDVTGNEVTTGFYAPCQMIFEVASFFNRTRSKENIQALCNCQGWFITYTQLNELFHTLPEFREFGRSVLVSGFALLKNRMLSTITETAEDRYAALLKSDPEIFQHAPLKYIASYLGITDTSLSRIRAGFSRK